MAYPFVSLAGMNFDVRMFDLLVLFINFIGPIGLCATESAALLIAPNGESFESARRIWRTVRQVLPVAGGLLE